MNYKLLFFCVFSINIYDVLANYSPIVTIPQGQLRGVNRTNKNGDQFFAYRSIPYAKPPIRTLRFLPPVEHQGWEGILNATEDIPLCFQGIGTEDCLYLNVFTKSIRNLETAHENLKPVLVFFHGGAFIFMGPQEDFYNPEYLMTEDVVLVTVAYRLGLLGFLNLKDENEDHVIANAGLKDQVLALQWIQKNIQFFGGNSKNVTLFGESAGAVSAHLHIFSPMSEGLFHRVILLSGSALHFWGIGRPGSGEQLIQKLNISAINNTDALVQLQNYSVNSIYQTQTTMEILGDIRKPSLFFPIVEGNTPGAFLLEDPKDLIISGKYTHVPIIIGYNSREGIFFDVFNKLFNSFAFLYDLKYLIPNDLHATDLETSNKIIEELKIFYFNGQQPIQGRDEQQWINLLTDVIFVYGTIKAVRSHYLQGDTVFFYEFGADTKLNFLKRFTSVTAEYEGASHMDELGYLFKNINSPPVEDGSIEDRMIDKMVGMWINFAYVDNPTPPNSDILWNSVEIRECNNMTDINYFRIRNDSFTNEINPKATSVMFWDYIYRKYGHSNDDNH